MTDRREYLRIKAVERRAGAGARTGRSCCNFGSPLRPTNIQEFPNDNEVVVPGGNSRFVLWRTSNFFVTFSGL